MLRLISIDNLSGGAYRLCKPAWNHSLRFETPARIHELVADHHCDAALLPVASLPEMGSLVDVIGDCGIACRGPVQSVQLFSSRPLEYLLHQHVPIYATPKSRSSIELFRILCTERYGMEPEFTKSYPGGAAHLLIGDGAFQYAQRGLNTEHDVDLSGWWFEHTGLPFVFARWVVSKSLPQVQREAVAEWLESCVQRAGTPGGQERLAHFGGQEDVDGSQRNYFTHLRNRLTEDDMEGMKKFFQLMEGSRYDRTARSA